MTVASLAPLLTAQFFDNQGNPLVGGLLFSYQAGTNTPAATYIDSTGTTTNTNPIVLNSRGEASVWLLPNTGYKFVLQDSSGNPIWTRDQVFNGQLITYYGIDSGAANAYILTAATPYTSYQNGMLVFFVASNTNTGPSTVNINGLGVIPIVTITGAPLGAGQIQAGIFSEIIYLNGVFQLVSIGSFAGPTVGTIGTEVPIASAATTDLGLAPAHAVLITGTTTITSFGTTASVQAPYYFLRFSGSLTLTYNATTFTMPGNASIVTSAGDSAIAQYLGNGIWRIAFYQYATGIGSNAKIKPGDTVLVSQTTPQSDPDLQSNTLAVGRYSWEAFLIFDSVAAGAGFKWTNGGSAVDSRGAAPAVAYGQINAAAYGPKSETPYGTTITYATVSTAANSNDVMYKGSLLISTPGTFGISWAQNSSTASNTTLRAGSYLVLTLLNTGTSAGIVTHTYNTPGSGVETIPAGFNTLVIEVWGGGGGGGLQFGSGINESGGGGGASGAYSRTSISVTGHAGNTLNFTVGAGGAISFAGSLSNVTSGTFTVTTMTAAGGGQGQPATASASPGAGGTPGVSSGGTVVNTNGNAGNAGLSASGGQTGGVGGFGIPGINGGGGAGGSGGGINGTAQAGGGGLVIFSYS